MVTCCDCGRALPVACIRTEEGDAFCFRCSPWAMAVELAKRVPAKKPEPVKKAAPLLERSAKR